MLKNCYRIFFLFFIFIKNFLLAEIIEVKSFHEILNYLPSQKQASVFFVFDIDDTLLNTKQMLGSDQWFLDRISIYQKMQYPVQEAFEKTLAEWEGVRHLTQMELVEDQINNIIAQMQEKHATILGLTIQGLALTNRTIVQLKDLGIDLSLTAPSKKDHYLMIEDHGMLYRKGILFTSGKNKGEALLELCKTLEFYPTKIIAIDDKKVHLEAIEKMAVENGISFVGLRYGYNDERKSRYSSQLADIQWRHSTLSHLIDDEEAQRIAN